MENSGLIKTVQDTTIIFQDYRKSNNRLRFGKTNETTSRLRLSAPTDCPLLNMDWSDHTKLLQQIQQDGWALRNASEDLKNNREIVLAAVKQDGDALRYASEDIKIDKEIVMAAVKQQGYALQYASAALRNDRDITRTFAKRPI